MPPETQPHWDPVSALTCTVERERDRDRPDVTHRLHTTANMTMNMGCNGIHYNSNDDHVTRSCKMIRYSLTEALPLSMAITEHTYLQDSYTHTQPHIYMYLNDGVHVGQEIIGPDVQ